MSREIYHKMELVAARDGLPASTAHMMADAIILERAAKWVIDSYLPGGLSAAERHFGKSQTKTEQEVLDSSDTFIDDIKPLIRVFKDTHTLGDFPNLLGRLRQWRLRQVYDGVSPTWRNWVNASAISTTPSFDQIPGIRVSPAPELIRRAEAENVKYMTFSEAPENNFRAIHYERAIRYTWEMSLSPYGLRALQAMAASAGSAARRTEETVVLTALSTLAISAELGLNTPAAFSITRADNMRKALSGRTTTDGDGLTRKIGLRMNGLIYPADEITSAVLSVLNQEFTNFQGGDPNPVRSSFAPFGESRLFDFTALGYIGFDRSQNWLEVVYKEGFEGGPKTYTKLPDVAQYQDEGSFENHSLDIKVGIAIGAQVVAPEAAVRAAGN
jgi:hypothetical protein